MRAEVIATEQALLKESSAGALNLDLTRFVIRQAILQGHSCRTSLLSLLRSVFGARGFDCLYRLKEKGEVEIDETRDIIRLTKAFKWDRSYGRWFGTKDAIDLVSSPAFRYENYQFWDSYGQIRLSRVREHFDAWDTFDWQTILCGLYAEWVRDDDWLIFRHKTKESESYHAVKASKRGNDVDCRRIDARMRNIYPNIREYCDEHSTRCIFITLTISPWLYPEIRTAWEDIGIELNRFLSALRKAYGKISVLRSWESHQSGLPHCHMIICFHSKSFVTLRHKDKDTGLWSYRIPFSERSRIAELWGIGHIDIRAITGGNLEESLRSVLWYVSKDKCNDYDYHDIENWDRKKVLTEACLWIFRKRSYSVSKNLVVHTSSPDLICRSKIIQTNLNGEECEDGEIDDESLQERGIWEFLGMIRGVVAGLDSHFSEQIFADEPDWIIHCWFPHSWQKRSIKRRRSLDL